MDHARAPLQRKPSPLPEAPIRTLVVSLLGAAAIAAGVLIIRQVSPEIEPRTGDRHAGEKQLGTISLDRIRELGY